MINAEVKIKYTTLVGGSKQSAVIPFRVEVDGANTEELTPQQSAITHTLMYFLKNYVVSEQDTIEVVSVQIL